MSRSRFKKYVRASQSIFRLNANKICLNSQVVRQDFCVTMTPYHQKANPRSTLLLANKLPVLRLPASPVTTTTWKPWWELG